MPNQVWDRVPVIGWYSGPAGAPEPGTINLTVTERVRETAADGSGRMIYAGGARQAVTIGDVTQHDLTAREIVRAAMRTQAEAATTAAGGTFDGVAWDVAWVESLDRMVCLSFRANDDPDITPKGFQVKVTEGLQSGAGKTYYIETPLSVLDRPIPAVNLADIEVPPGSTAAPAPIYAKGQPGGVASLDAQGLVPAGQLPAPSGYEPPTGGIPEGDLTQDVRAALAAAGTAVQPAALGPFATDDDLAAALAALPGPPDLSPYVTGATLDDVLDAYVETTTLTAALQLKAASVHEHVTGDVTGLAGFVDGRVQQVVGAAPAALDTLVELAGALGNDANFAGTVTTALGHRVRSDAAQSLTGPQQAQARTNIGAGTSSLTLGTTSGSAKPGDYTPPGASTTTPGLVEIATVTEATTGTDTSRAVTPAGLAAGVASRTALSVDGVFAASYDLDTTPLTAADVGAYTTAQVDDLIEAVESTPPAGGGGGGFAPVQDAGTETNFTVAYANIAGLSLTVTATGPSDVYVVDLYVDLAAYAANTGFLVLVLTVDGVGQPVTVPVRLPNNTRVIIPCKWVISGLTVGTHTFQAAGYGAGTNTTFSYQSGSGTTLTVERKV